MKTKNTKALADIIEFNNTAFKLGQDFIINTLQTCLNLTKKRDAVEKDLTAIDNLIKTMEQQKKQTKKIEKCIRKNKNTEIDRTFAEVQKNGPSGRPYENDYPVGLAYNLSSDHSQKYQSPIFLTNNAVASHNTQFNQYHSKPYIVNDQTGRAHGSRQSAHGGPPRNARSNDRSSRRSGTTSDQIRSNSHSDYGSNSSSLVPRSHSSILIAPSDRGRPLSNSGLAQVSVHNYPGNNGSRSGAVQNLQGFTAPAISIDYSHGYLTQGTAYQQNRSHQPNTFIPSENELNSVSTSPRSASHDTPYPTPHQQNTRGEPRPEPNTTSVDTFPKRSMSAEEYQQQQQRYEQHY